MLGAPVTGSADEWRPLQRVVSGRIVNGYSRSSSGSYVHPYLHTHTFNGPLSRTKTVVRTVYGNSKGFEVKVGMHQGQD